MRDTLGCVPKSSFEASRSRTVSDRCTAIQDLITASVSGPRPVRRVLLCGDDLLPTLWSVAHRSANATRSGAIPPSLPHRPLGGHTPGRPPATQSVSRRIVCLAALLRNTHLSQCYKLRIRRFGVRVPTGAPSINLKRREPSTSSRRFAVSAWRARGGTPVPVRGFSLRTGVIALDSTLELYILLTRDACNTNAREPKRAELLAKRPPMLRQE